MGTTGGGSNAWSSLIGGDGGYVAVDPTNTNTLYGENTDLSFQKSTNGGSSWSGKTSGISDSGVLFITPFTIDPNNAQTLWLGGTYLWRTTNGAPSWTSASKALGGNVSAIGVAGGALPAIDLVAAGNLGGHDFLHRYGAHQHIHHYLVERHAARSNAWVSWVAYDPNNNSTIYATYSSFKSQASDNHVYKSTNGGVSWTGIDGNGASGLPDVPVQSIVVNPNNSQMLFIATDLGVYSSTTGGNTWNVETTGFGDAPAISLTILQPNNTGSYYLYAFTHGYGVWSAPILGSAACTYSLSSNVNTPASGGSGL